MYTETPKKRPTPFYTYFSGCRHMSIPVAFWRCIYVPSYIWHTQNIIFEWHIYYTFFTPSRKIWNEKDISASFHVKYRYSFGTVIWLLAFLMVWVPQSSFSLWNKENDRQAIVWHTYYSEAVSHPAHSLYPQPSSSCILLNCMGPIYRAPVSQKILTLWSSTIYWNKGTYSYM